MSKRSNQELFEERNKRSKIEGHTQECSGKDCLGCDVGEIEISFTSNTADGQVETIQLNASELLISAIDESNQKNDEMARRLFDLALEKFQEEPEDRVGYAICLVELGKAIEVEESIKEGLDILRGEIKKNSDNPELKLKLAYSNMILANHLRKQKSDNFAREEAKFEEEEGNVDEIAYEELLSKQVVTKDEIRLYTEAIDYTKKILKENKKFKVEIQSVISELKSFGVSLDLKVQREHSTIVLNTAIELIKQLPGFEDNWEIISIWAVCLSHQEKLLDKSEDRKKVITEAIEMAKKANEYHIKKLSKEHPFMCELIAGLYMTKSSVSYDDDEVIELYNLAVKAFEKAYALAPEKIELAEMIKVLQGLNNSDSIEQKNNSENESDK